MTLNRAVLLGLVSGAALSASFFVAGLFTPVNGLYGALVFVVAAPLFDRLALRIGGDAGPRVFWDAATWTTPFLVICSTSAGVLGWRQELIPIAVATMAPAALIGGRRLGLHSGIVRRAIPWIALVTTLILTVGVAAKAPLRTVAFVAAAGLTTAFIALLRRANDLAQMRDLDGRWRSGAMSAEGLVTVEGLPPMHAPAGILHFAGPVLVQLDTDVAATTFRTTGAPTITRLLQGMDADLAGRRGILRDGVRAYATATVLLTGAGVWHAVLLH